MKVLFKNVYELGEVDLYQFIYEEQQILNLVNMNYVPLIIPYTIKK